ncbi:MAG: hypothetical protein DRQ39_11625 [Gammaproteobacteria bacterium]|nr:MAG: hypothetical protein DRQ39_11625 [Gammaproteobacteria bacterium]
MTNDRLVSYAKMIALNHEEEYEEVRRRIDIKLLDRFRRGDKLMRESVAAIINAEDIFLAELRILIAESVEQDK